MNLNFMDAANGIETPIQISHKQACPTCQRQGHRCRFEQSTCPTCGGRAAFRNRPDS